MIRNVFSKGTAPSAGAVAPEKLVAKLEETLAMRKDAWPLTAIRSFSDVLAEVAGGRAKSPQHEVRWLNLAGFCLRPGFGAPLDESRMNQLRKVYLSPPAFPREIPSQVELLVLLRRVAAGLNPSQQNELYRNYAASIGGAANKRNRPNPQVERDTWRLLAGLEHIPAQTRAQLGDTVVGRIKKDSADRALFWSLARLGARVPLYGPAKCVVAPEIAAEWIEALLGLRELTPESAFAIIQIGALTGDRGREIAEPVRSKAFAKLSSAGLGGDALRRLQEVALPARSEIERLFGESLPHGLHLVTSANCLLSLTALTAELPGESPQVSTILQ